MANARLCIGRLGLDVATNSEVDPFPGITWEGDRLSFSGMLRADTTNGGAVLRQQLNGYGPHNTDEPVIPVTWSGDATVDGFYYPLSTEVQADDGSYVGDNWWFPFTAELLRCQNGYQIPTTEVMMSQALRQNDHSIPSASNFGFASYPATANGFAVGAVNGTRNSLTLGSGATLYIYDLADTTNWNLSSYTYRVPAASYYDGATRIESGTNFTASTNGMSIVVGEQIQNTPTAWRLNNDLIRVYPTSATASNFTVSIYDGSNWEAIQWTPTFLASGTNYSLGVPQSVTVINNRADTGTLRIGYELYGATGHPTLGGTYTFAGISAYMDLTVRRGMRHVEGVTVITGSSSAGRGGIFRTQAEAGTTLTGGMEATTADAAGNKYRVYAANSKTDNLTQGGFSQAAGVALGTPFKFGIGNNMTNGIARYYFNAAEFMQTSVVL